MADAAEHLGPQHWRERLADIEASITALERSADYQAYLADLRSEDFICDDDEGPAAPISDEPESWDAFYAVRPELVARDRMDDLERTRGYVLWQLEEALKREAS